MTMNGGRTSLTGRISTKILYGTKQHGFDQHMLVVVTVYESLECGIKYTIKCFILSCCRLQIDSPRAAFSMEIKASEKISFIRNEEVFQRRALKRDEEKTFEQIVFELNECSAQS